MAGPDVVETIDPTTGNITTTTTIVDPVTGDGTSTSITVDPFGQEIAKSTSGSSTDPATGDRTLKIETTDLTTGVTTTHETVTDANGNQKLDSDRTTNPDGTSHETGTQVDPTGAITTEYTIDRVKNPDGSSSFTRTDQSSDGSSSRSEGGKDAEGNSSVTTRAEEADGSIVLIVRTLDKDGNGTERRTKLDSDGTVRSDGIFDVVDGMLQPDPVPVDPDPDPVDPDPDPVDPDPDPVDPDPDPVDPDPDPVDPDPFPDPVDPDPFPDPVDPDPFPDPVDPGPFPGPSGPDPDPFPDPGRLVVIDPFNPQHKVPKKLPAENFLRRVSEPSYRSADVLVYDDVLPDPAFSRLFRHLGSLDYSSVHRSGWRKVWRLHDGDPLRARTTWYQPGEGEGTGDVHPAGSAIGELISWITDRQDEIAGIVGTAGTEWEKISFTPWIYPVGSGLSLHQDGTTYSGAFTYFAHREWRLHWGGHLMVMDSRTRSRLASPGESGPAAFDDRQESLRAFDPGFALTVFPKPNRIAFLSPRAMHLLTRVDTNAGQQARISVAGFFHRKPLNRPAAAHSPKEGQAANPGSRGYGRPRPTDRVR